MPKQMQEAGFDFSGIENLLDGEMSLEEYVNTMGPIWQLMQEYRTIDDELRDLSIGLAILSAFAAPMSMASGGAKAFAAIDIAGGVADAGISLLRGDNAGAALTLAIEILPEVLEGVARPGAKAIDSVPDIEVPKIHGATETATEAIELAGKTSSLTVIQSMNSFMDDLGVILEKEAIDLPTYTRLRLTPPEMLSPEEIKLLVRIRESIPMPDSDTLLSKVITKSTRENFLNNGLHSDTIGGYFARAQDTKGLYTYNDYYNTVRLDYTPPGFDPINDEFISVVRFTTDNTSAIKIPYGGISDADLTDVADATGIPRTELVKQKWPFSGNGFTVSETSKTVLEFVTKTD